MTTVAPAETGTTPAERPRRRWLGWWRTPDGKAVAILVLVPLAVFVMPALAGHPAIAGDNLIQNFPLRVLTGDQLRQGHLPLWNPFIWSGSPLLGGLNSGSFYPLTFAFAFLAPVAAWVLNLLATYWAAGLGLYALGRQYGLRPLPCLLAGLVYAFGGAMSGQMVHLGVVQGMGWEPLLVLAQLRLSWAVLGTGPAAVSPGAAGGRSGATDAAALPRRSSPWPWVVLLAAMIGLEALTGEPRAMAETEIVAAAVTLWLVLRPSRPAPGLRRRVAFLAFSALAGLWGVALAAAELAPGWSFIRASQRAVEGYWFFGSGSLPLRWTSLLFVPDLFGTAGRLEQPTFFNHYNLPEVTGYMGLLALGAALVLLSRSFGRRRDPGAADWGLWLALLVLGLFLTWGSYTPLGHLWAAIPLFGQTRLQSRNLGIVDLALAMLLAFWADRALDGRGADAGLAGWRRWAMTAPALVSAGLCVAVMAAPTAVEEWFGTNYVGGELVHYLIPSLIVQMVIAAATLALVFGWPRLSAVRRRWGLAVLVVVDLAVFCVSAGTALSFGSTTLEPTAAQARSVLGPGRFAIYDTTDTDVGLLSAVGQPDLNAFTEISSVQGYGSILSENYGDATGTHTLDDLTSCALAQGVFDPLQLSTMLVAPGGLAMGDTTPARPTTPPAACPGSPAPGTSTRRTLYLGFALDMSSATLVALRHVPAKDTVRVGVLGQKGATHHPALSVRRTAHGWHVRFAHPVVGYGLVVEGPARAVSDTSTVTGLLPQGLGSSSSSTSSTSTGTAPAKPGRWAFDGAVQNAMGSGGWRYAGMWQGVAVFRHAIGPPVWLAGAPTGSHVTRVSTTSWGTEVDRVVAARPVTVVRSEAYLAGWHAVATPVGGGPSRQLTVSAHGLVQSVRVPAGDWTLTFRYRAPHLTVGLAASAAGLAAMVAAGGWALVQRRRRSRAG